MIFDIIIPSFGCSPDITVKAIRCLETICEHSQDYRVLWIDNGTPGAALAPVLAILDTMPHVLIRNRVNQGFVKATNQGLRFSTAPYVVLMNNDTEAAPNWLEKLREPFEDTAARDAMGPVGMSGPLTTTPNSWQGRWPKTKKGWTHLAKGRMLAAFCLMMSRQCLEMVGFHDESFDQFGGFGGDDLLALTVERAGFELALVQDLIIPHHHRSSFKALYSDETIKEMQAEALAMFHEKRKATT